MRLLDLLSQAQHKAERQLPVPADGTYMTDGASLFRVAGTLVDINNDVLVELEDCCTLDLILVPAARATGPGLRPVGLHEIESGTKALARPA